jgi:hypothetical protein
MELFGEFFSIVRRLELEGVDYCVIGGLAMAFHDRPRFTRDIDLLVPDEAAGGAFAVLRAAGYAESAEPWSVSEGVRLHRFLKSEGDDMLVVDLLTAADERHRRIVADAVEEQWAEGRVRIARKADLAWLKQQRGSDQDRVDIGRLSDDQDREDDQGGQ